MGNSRGDAFVHACVWRFRFDLRKLGEPLTLGREGSVSSTLPRLGLGERPSPILEHPTIMLELGEQRHTLRGRNRGRRSDPPETPTSAHSGAVRPRCDLGRQTLDLALPVARPGRAFPKSRVQPGDLFG